MHIHSFLTALMDGKQECELCVPIMKKKQITFVTQLTPFFLFVLVPFFISRVEYLIHKQDIIVTEEFLSKQTVKIIIIIQYSNGMAQSKHRAKLHILNNLSDIWYSIVHSFISLLQILLKYVFLFQKVKKNFGNVPPWSEYIGVPLFSLKL